MKLGTVVLVVVVMLIAFITGCSVGDVSGTYQQKSRTIKLTKEKKLILVFSGESADYAIEGNKIIVTNPIFGAAEGSIEGNTLVFPSAKGVVAGIFRGTWVKQ